MDLLIRQLVMKNRGFTLIELLVVVAIMATLTAIGLAVYGPQQQSARDARRKADINSIADAMEAKYDTNNPGQYSALDSSFFSSGYLPSDPLPNTALCANSICTYCVGQWQGGTPSPTPGGCVVTPTPLVIATGVPAGGNRNNWRICANLEKAGSGPGGQNYYCRQNRQ